MNAVDYDDITLRTIYDQCCLCVRAARPQSAGRLDALPPEERLLLERDGFCVSGARGAFIDGWLLAFPTRHVTSLYHLSESELRVLEGVLTSIRTLFARLYDSPLFAFEHGSPTDRTCHTGRCVDHAHLHCLPIRLGELGELGQFPQSRILSLSDLHEHRWPAEPYVLVTGEAETLVMYETGVIPSQWMRRLLATRVNVPDLWDWRVHPMPAVVDATNIRIGKRLRDDDL